MIAPVALALVAAACGTGSGADGHVRVERTAKRTTTLMDEPGRADYCLADSVLVIIAIGRNRAAGLAARTLLPLREMHTFVVRPELGGLGTATAAFRLVNGSARLGTSGRLRLEASDTLEGEFEIAVPDSASTTVRFKGKLSRVPIRSDPSAACSSV
jgi:hypothetical protein